MTQTANDRLAVQPSSPRHPLAPLTLDETAAACRIALDGAPPGTLLVFCELVEPAKDVVLGWDGTPVPRLARCVPPARAPAPDVACASAYVAAVPITATIATAGTMTHAAGCRRAGWRGAGYPGAAAPAPEASPGFLPNRFIPSTSLPRSRARAGRPEMTPSH